MDVALDFASAHPVLVAVVLLCVALKLVALLGGYRPGKWNPPTADELVDYSSGSGPHYTTDPTEAATVRVAKAGVSALAPRTLPRLFKQAVERSGSKPALKVERGRQWITHTWREYYDESEKVAMSLIALGLKPHDRVNIIGFNSPEWFMAEMG